MKTCKNCGTERVDVVIKCPVCTKAHNAAYHAANREKHTARMKAYRADNREHTKAYQAANKEKMTLYKKAYNADNREKINLKGKAYYTANPEKAITHGAKKTLRKNGIDPAQNKELVNAITKLRFISQLIKLRKNENNRK